ncbi:long-chain fatty acid transport protein [Neorhizobium huautlense]|uniref:Long-chain fatty acid transport protein n=1 Tax=Neorhizobium huautlense TaxID=67774 RepID=A0ABT9PUT1_9HYPH|nr:OmpP1/FadL family transporter [Neorhizobium huautlense]MDP9837921.1 long-chain fatty acid transport protein [Neorhizobium huautlense]
MTFNKKTATIVLAAGGLLAAQAPVFAGGLERGGYNIDLLFDPSSVAVEAATTFVAPQRKLKNVEDVDTTSAAFPGNGTGPGFGGGDLNGLPNSANDSENYWSTRLGVKVGYENTDCMFDYSQPWGAHLKPGRNWAGANQNIETKVESRNYALTCSYRFDVGPGQLRVIGGGFYQEVYGFKERLVQDLTGLAPLSGVGRLDLEGDGWGWRAGVAYEIPEYALRASLVYNSEVKLDNITGTLNLTQVPAPVGGLVLPVFGSQAMPDSLELKVQSGIAPDWLAFGSVKWTDWSQLQRVSFRCNDPASPLLCGPTLTATSLDLGYRDGWTVSGGIGHKFNDQWSGAVSLTWDRGTSEGFGTQTDTWTVGTGVSYTPTENVEFRLAGVLGILTSGSSREVMINGEPAGDDVHYDFGNDLVAAISTSVKVKF